LQNTCSYGTIQKEKEQVFAMEAEKWEGKQSLDTKITAVKVPQKYGKGMAEIREKISGCIRQKQ